MDAGVALPSLRLASSTASNAREACEASSGHACVCDPIGFEPPPAIPKDPGPSFWDGGGVASCPVLPALPQQLGSALTVPRYVSCRMTDGEVPRCQGGKEQQQPNHHRLHHHPSSPSVVEWSVAIGNGRIASARAKERAGRLTQLSY